MNPIKPVAVAAPLQTSRPTASMPLPALLFRWFIGVVGLVLLLSLAPTFSTAQRAELLVLLIVSVAADLWLTVELTSRRFLALGATFTFFTFLAFGPLGAALVSVIGLIIAQGMALLTGRTLGRLQLIFTIFNAGQLALCALGAGLVVIWVTGAPWNASPAEWLEPLIVYGMTYLVINISITSIATALRYGMREVREQLWPRVSAWTVLSFAICTPLALMAQALAVEIGVLSSVLLTFVALGALSYILRLNLRYDRANAELTVLNEIGASLAGALDFGTLFPAIYRGTSKLMDVDAFSIALIDNQQREIRYTYLIEDGNELAPRTQPLVSSPLTEVLQSREPRLVDVPSQDGAVLPRFRRGKRPAQAALVVPLATGDRLIGAITVQSRRTQAYTAHHLDLLVAIGRVAAIAIRNAQLFEREKALLREREEFVSLVAHELKSPLAAISGYHQIAARRLRPDDDGLRRPLEVIAEQTDRLNHLIEDLLDLSRADAGRLALNNRVMDIARIIRDVVDQQQIQTATHQINIAIDDGLPDVDVDPMRIGQVIQNLLSNAIKYSPAGGLIDIRARVWRNTEEFPWPDHLRHEADRRPQWVVVEVQDRGLGIPRAEQQHVFDRFFRASNTQHNDIQGIGLGLSICAELVRAQQGMIWVTSEVGEGSIFAFALPVA
jgi:signal transduction histidine kinase